MHPFSHFLEIKLKKNFISSHEILKIKNIIKTKIFKN